MYIIKANGEKEEFEKEKIIRTLSRSDVERNKAEEIAKEIEKNVSEGDTTRYIYKLILKELDKLEPISSFVYKLREAISKIDSLKFELYIKQVLEANGYTCIWNKVINGDCITHQIDIIAEKDFIYFVECKHHLNHHKMFGLGGVLEIQARLEDLKDGYKKGKNKFNFKQAWLINNAKISNHAKRYAKAKNIKLTGWRFGGDESLEWLVQKKKIYPISVLKIDENSKKRLFNNNILTIQDLFKKSDFVRKILKNKFDYVLKQARHLT